METLKAKWQEMGLYRRILLAVMLAEIVGFLIAYVIVVNRPGLEYSGALLYPHTEGELQIYEGKIDGEPARFAVSPEGEISYQWGEYTYGPWQVVVDPTAVPDGFRGENGLEIRRGDEVIFRGTYSPHSFNLLIDENGDPVRDTFSVGSVGGGATLYYVNGQEVTREEWYEPGLGALARIVLTPELTHQGNLLLWFGTTLIALLNIFQICFPHFFFRLGLQLRVRNVDAVEPSDFYIAMEKLEWAILAVLCLVLYATGLTVIM